MTQEHTQTIMALEARLSGLEGRSAAIAKTINDLRIQENDVNREIGVLREAKYGLRALMKLTERDCIHGIPKTHSCPKCMEDLNANNSSV